MDLEPALAFVRDHHRAVLHTRRSDDGPQLSPVVVAPDRDGLPAISTRRDAVKVRNLERDPRASLLVLTDDFFGPWVRLDGTAEVVALPEALEGLVDVYRGVAGEHDDWEEFRRAMERERRVLVRLHVEHAGPDVSG